MATVQTSIDIDSREGDALTHLEERIQKTVALVTRLRNEKESVLKELSAAQSALASTKAELEESQMSNMQLTDDVNALRSEKAQVRTRLEKLLGHIDQLGAV
jgi:chromosome segregation ATPase